MSNTPAIELTGVGKDYPHFCLEDVNLSLEPGRIMGFIGPNGAGKSTTLRIIMGLVRADRGQVSVMGHRMPTGEVAAKWDIGFASEDMKLYGAGTLRWHMDFIRSLYADWDESYATKLCRRFDLRPEQRIKGMSHGQKVKSGLLLVLARRPRLLILDEPTTGLDPVARREVLNELMEVLTDDRRTVLFSSHNTKDVEQLSDKITFIDRGHVIASQDRETFLERWRRIRIETPDTFRMPELDGLTESRSSGRLATLTMERFTPDQTELLKRNGAVVHGVETMTLEEIFVAEVMKSREGEAA